MKKLFSKIKTGACWLGNVIKKPFVKFGNSKLVQSYLGSKFHKTWIRLWSDYAFFMHIPLALILVFEFLVVPILMWLWFGKKKEPSP